MEGQAREGRASNSMTPTAYTSCFVRSTSVRAPAPLASTSGGL